MTRFSRALAVSAAVVFIADTSAAQTPSWLLNRLEVQRLVSVNTPDAHARLSKHSGHAAVEGDLAKTTARSGA
jgi:hypothetical protein